MRVLLTGYEPFGGEPVNPSAELVTALAGDAAGAGGARLQPALELSAVVLPVDRSRFRAAVASAVTATRPEWIVSVGQATGRAQVGLETIARNALDFRGERDNGGHAAQAEILVPDGPERLHVRLPAASLARRLADAGLPVSVSFDAGRHLCNALLYELLLRHAAVPALFVHVPLLPEQARRRALGEPSLPAAVTRQCLASLLIALAEWSRAAEPAGARAPEPARP